MFSEIGNVRKHTRKVERVEEAEGIVELRRENGKANG